MTYDAANLNKHKCTLGILAHVDAGKTTLAEGLLYHSGAIRTAGRVDHGDAHLDTDAMERQRGITIFSKPARFESAHVSFTIIDTPGHVDFSPELERSVSVMDACILVISGTEGIQSHTETIWKLLAKNNVPVLIFVNKTDLAGFDRDRVLAGLRGKFSEECIVVSDPDPENVERLAACNEELLNAYLETGDLPDEMLRKAVAGRELFPVCFGAALRGDGIRELLDLLDRICPVYEEAAWLSACCDRSAGSGSERSDSAQAADSGCGPVYKVYKISRDKKGARLTHIKLLSGSIRPRSALSGEKVNEIRFYDGNAYIQAQGASAGDICALTGPESTRAGELCGVPADLAEEFVPYFTPLMSCALILPEGTNIPAVYEKIRELTEEEPALFADWNEEKQEIRIRIMGEVQKEVFKEFISERLGMSVSLSDSAPVYRETIKNTVEGVGHYEPLKHYAEVHLLMEPLPPGSGIVTGTVCSEEVLERHYQNLVLTHLNEKPFKGVLAGSEITDMKITLLCGRAHLKHTEGGDFRQAVYRAVRQGLMQADSVLLESTYDFEITLPTARTGRAMSDIQNMGGTSEIAGNTMDATIIRGNAPAGKISNYAVELASYTGGYGTLTLSPGIFKPCRDADEVIESMEYDPDRDLKNPSSSVFCSHGAGTEVKWDEVFDHMHLPLLKR